MKYEIPVMLRTGGGAIVNTASILGMRAGRGVPAYTASKHGVVGLTRAAALDYGRSGLRINAVCPGPIRTAMYHRREGTDPATEARFAEAIPLGRMGSAADVAAAVVWLCSDASSFITGHALTMDGGGRL